jgi:Tfp pilus assembly protein PilF
MSREELKQRVAEAIGERDFLRAERLCHEAEGGIPAPEIHFIRGVLCSEQGDLQKAQSFLKQACEALPERGDVAYNYGVVLQKTGCLSEAVQVWEKATALDPQNAAAWVNLTLGIVLLGEKDKAEDRYRKAIARHPTNRDLLYNYANFLYRLGHLTESESVFRKLLEIYREDASGWINLGMTLKALKQFDKSEACYRQAIALNDTANEARAYFNLANLLLQEERWREGFKAYEWRLKLPSAIESPWGIPAWRNDLPQGSRVLLWNDQGLGDAIMFLRFAPLLAEKGCKLFVFAQKSLQTLAATASCIEAVFSPLDDPQPMDACLPLCSLPHALGLASMDVWRGPYLRPPEKSVFPFDKNASASKRIGIVWAGNPGHVNDANRSLRFPELAPLLDMPGIEWFSLQVGRSVAELEASPYHDRVKDLSPCLTDFSATASVIAELDLLITVDTAPAHLAGALGKPVWTLLPAVGTDWRWKTEGNTTFWYPSMRLFRQKNAGEWDSVIAEMAECLQTMFPGISDRRTICSGASR